MAELGLQECVGVFPGETVNLHIDRGKRKVFRRKEGAAAEDQQAGGGRREDHVHRPAQVCFSHPS